MCGGSEGETEDRGLVGPHACQLDVVTRDMQVVENDKSRKGGAAGTKVGVKGRGGEAAA
jgi:hypothetical protein